MRTRVEICVQKTIIKSTQLNSTSKKVKITDLLTRINCPLPSTSTHLNSIFMILQLKINFKVFLIYILYKHMKYKR